MQNKLYAEGIGNDGCMSSLYKNRHDAEEITGGVYKVYVSSPVSTKGPLEAWIKKIMVNCALQKLKNKKAV